MSGPGWPRPHEGGGYTVHYQGGTAYGVGHTSPVIWWPQGLAKSPGVPAAHHGGPGVRTGGVPGVVCVPRGGCPWSVLTPLSMGARRGEGQEGAGSGKGA